MKKQIDTTAQTLTFTFGDGLEPVTLKISDVSPANATYAMLHGFAQRCGDAAAIQKSEENGFVVTETMRRAAVEEMVRHYASGSVEWNLKGSARAPKQHPSIVKLAAKWGCTYEEAEQRIAALDDI